MKVWLYLLKHKNETFNKFKKWKTLVKNQVGRKVKTLSTDNRLEYLLNEINLYCKSEGIVRHNTVRETPQQNGLIKK